MAIKIRKRGSDGDQPDTEASDAQGQVAPEDADPILEATLRGATWMEKNRNLVIGGVVALVVAAIGVWVGTSYIEGQEVEASQSLSPALWDYGTVVEGSQEMEQIKKSDRIEVPEHTFPNEEARWQAIYDQAGAALDKHASGPLAQSARLTKAGAAMHLDKYDEAIKLYDAYLGGKTDEAMLPFVYLGLGNAYGAKGEADKAAANFDKLVEQDDSYEAMAMYKKAQVLGDAGKTDAAKELYHEILESHPKTPYRDDIERRLALL